MPFLVKPAGKLLGMRVFDDDSQMFFRDVVVKEINKRTSKRKVSLK